MYFSIPKEYSDVTGVRHCSISEFSGEDFYHKKLNAVFAEAFRLKEKLILDLDGSLDGYSPSFIDEAIGNLIYDFSPAVVESMLEIRSVSDDQWKTLIKEKTFPNWKNRYDRKEEPKKTEPHPAWFRLIDGQLKSEVWVEC